MIRTLNIIAIVLFTCACTILHAQVNLVRNPSFEQYNNCPHDVHEVLYADYWTGIVDTGWSPDLPVDSFVTPPAGYCLPTYYNTCDNIIDDPSRICTLPGNQDFYHYPRTGNALMGGRMFYDYSVTGFTFGTEQYMQGRLYSTLTAGQSYCVTFYVFRDASSGAGYAINHIGAYLDDGTVDSTTDCGKEQTEYAPQVVDTPVITDTLNWTKIQGSFIANGTERFITIGNFFDTAHTEHILVAAAGYFAYYLVDDVSVIASNATAYAGPDQTITAGCYTNIGVDSNGDGMPCYWYVLGGTTAIDSGGTMLVHPLTTTTYVVSMDLCGTVTTDTVTVNVTPCTGLPVVGFTDTGSSTVGFTYTGVTGCIDTISWSFGDGSTSSAVNPVHTYSAVGTYTVCVTDYTYCGSNSDCQTVTITCPTPVAAFTDTGNTTMGFTYTGTITSLDSVVWNFGDGSTGSGMNPVHTYSVANTYTVCVTAYTACGNDTVCSTINVTLAVPNLKIGQFENLKIYPNPAGDHVTIEGAQGCEVRIFNMVGEEVKRLNCQKGKEVISISNLVNGVYMVRITNSVGEQKNVQLLKG